MPRPLFSPMLRDSLGDERDCLVSIVSPCVSPVRGHRQQQNAQYPKCFHGDLSAHSKRCESLLMFRAACDECETGANVTPRSLRHASIALRPAAVILMCTVSIAWPGSV